MFSKNLIKIFQFRYTEGDEQMTKWALDNYGWLEAENVADSVAYALQSPLQMDVHDIIIKPNN